MDDNKKCKFYIYYHVIFGLICANQKSSAVTFINYPRFLEASNSKTNFVISKLRFVLLEIIYQNHFKISPKKILNGKRGTIDVAKESLNYSKFIIRTTQPFN
jgi:uncharacterized membrane protein YhdT